MRYLLCNKPLNVICSKRNDAINPRKPHSAERVTIYEHVSALGYDVQHLALVGRLDVETTGAILFTDDVELMDHLLRPPNTTALASSYCFKEKQYRLVLLGRPPFHRLSSASREDIVRIETELAEPLEQCQRAAVCITRGPYRVESLSNNNNVDMGWCLEATVVISEGKYHQIRRMAARSKFIVVSLERRSFGNGLLSVESVPLGKARELSEEEGMQLRAAVGLT